MRRHLLPVVLLLWAVPAQAQWREPTPFRWTSHEEIPDQISTALVAAQLGAQVIDDWRSPHRKRALLGTSCAAGVSLLATEGLKRLVHRERPNKYDRKSFPSMHTALAASSAWWYPPAGASITVGVGWGRMASGWHFGTDVAVGAAIGIGAGALCR